jgi:octaprenyl-diphosphate synthase
MSGITNIKEPVKEHFANFELFFRQEMRSGVKLLNTVTDYIYRRKGKQFRPLLVLLSAKAVGEPGERSYRAATLIELLHTETLVHDDVVDDSNRRRGLFSINALWKNKVAVLTGDYLLSKGLLLSIGNEDFDLLKIVSEATREMSEGELMQIEKARRLDIEENIYFDIIRKKTASLTAASCAMGAVSTGAADKDVKALYYFGLNLGVAFQLKDDMFDYQNNKLTGKPTGIDIKEKKMTLPLIYYLGQQPWIKRKRIITNIKLYHNDSVKMAKLIEDVSHSGGFEYTAKKMDEYCLRANEFLKELPVNPAVDALKCLLDLSISRQY